MVLNGKQTLDHHQDQDIRVAVNGVLSQPVIVDSNRNSGVRTWSSAPNDREIAPRKARRLFQSIAIKFTRLSEAIRQRSPS